MKTTQALLLLLATTASCITPAPSTGEGPQPKPAPGQVAVSEQKEEEDSEELSGLSDEVDGSERELQEARLALDIEEFDAQKNLAEARRDVLQAERDVKVARESWAHFRDVESVLELAKVQLDVDRSFSRLESKRQDLQGILEIYEGEEEARAKEEIIRRNRKGVEFAQKALEQARLEARQVAEFEVPQKLESLQWDLGVAEAEKKQADDDLLRTEMKSRLALMKASNQVAESEQELEAKRKDLLKCKRAGEAAQ